MSLLRRREKANIPDEVKTRLQTVLLSEFGTSVDLSSTEARSQIEERFGVLLAEANLELNRADKSDLFNAVTLDLLGLGPLEALLLDETIGDIVITGPKMVYVRHRSKPEWERLTVTFRDDDHLKQVVRLLMPWRTVSRDQPVAHERHVNIGYITVTVPPALAVGLSLVIRKVRHKRLTAEEFIALGTLTAEELQYLQACVRAKLNLVISGDESAGKTTLLNFLCASIGSDEFIVTAEEPEALGLMQPIVMTLVAHPMYVTEHLSMNILITQALHMRPERLVVDELHLGETVALAKADYTHWLAAVRAAAVEEVTPQLAPGANVVVHLRYLPDGMRKVENIFRVEAIKDGAFVFADWRQSPVSPE